MLAGIREILIISSPEHLPGFQDMFKDGAHLGLDISYTAQPRPDGLAQAFILGKEFIGTDSVCLILGDNIFYGHGFYPILEECTSLQKGGIIFGYQVTAPHRYGIVSFDDNRNVLSIEEKPGTAPNPGPPITQNPVWPIPDQPPDRLTQYPVPNTQYPKPTAQH
jgi:glucose-1-phosphate thymidylyltransferase